MKARQSSVGLCLLQRPSDMEASLWRRLKLEGDPSCRAALFDKYQAFARRVALNEFGRRPAYGLERADFTQLAFRGLLEAVDRFDPLRGTPFLGYARLRIRGAISDGLSISSEGGAQFSHARRLERERINSLRETATLASDAISQLSDIAVALALGFLIQSSRTGERQERHELASLDAYESVAWREMEVSLLRELDRLPASEQTIVKQHYLQEMSFTDIASLLGLSKGRVSQLHRRALETLRRHLHAQP